MKMIALWVAILVVAVFAFLVAEWLLVLVFAQTPLAPPAAVLKLAALNIAGAAGWAVYRRGEL